MSRSQSSASSGLSVWANVEGRVFCSSDNLECGWYGSRWLPILMTWFIISWCCCWLVRRDDILEIRLLRCPVDWTISEWSCCLSVSHKLLLADWAWNESTDETFFQSGYYFAKFMRRTVWHKENLAKAKFERPQDFQENTNDFARRRTA